MSADDLDPFQVVGRTLVATVPASSGRRRAWIDARVWSDPPAASYQTWYSTSDTSAPVSMLLRDDDDAVLNAPIRLRTDMTAKQRRPPR